MVVTLCVLAYYCLTKRRGRGSGLDRMLDLSWPDSVPLAVRAIIDKAAALADAARSVSH